MTYRNKLKFKKSSVVLLLISLYGANYFVFERIFFFNELLSLIGFLYFIHYSFTKDFKFRFPRNTIYKYVLFFIILCVFYAFISLWLKTNWYYYFRNLSIIYSVFSFFIGFYLYKAQWGFFQKIRIWIYGYAFSSFILRWPNLIDRNAYMFWFAFLQKDWKPISILLLTIVSCIYVAAYTSASVVMVLVAILAFRFFIKTYLQFKIVLFLSILCFATIFSLAIPFLKLYKVSSSLFGDVVYVYSQHPWFNIDHNTSWRLIFWYRTIVESFPQNILGIGVGTPMLPYLSNSTTSDLMNSDEYIAHVIGAHNTFVTVFIRFGILSLVVMGLIYRSLIREFFFFKKYYYNHRNDISLFFAFIAITVVGSFNLLIETSTLASLYWISLGFIAGAINFRKYGKPPM